MLVTVDSTLWTADSTCWTADGRVICIDAGVAEPIHVEPIFGSVAADSTLYTADGILWTADGLAVAGAVAGATDSVDAVVEVAGAVLVVEAADALDQLDADVEAAEVPAAVGGGAHYPRRRPFPIEGVGYGILPQLEGEAHGVVILEGNGAGAIRGFVGEASGAPGVAGRSVGQLLVRAAATGAPGTRGSGAGMIVKFTGVATGRHDDDEAAVITFLLAA